MRVKVKSVSLDWKSPDGEKIKNIVVMDDGTLYRTWSKSIAVEGWEGEIEAYDDPKNPGQTLIRQPKKDGGWNSGGGQKFDSDGAAWGNALTNATSLVTTFGRGNTQLTTAEAMLETIKVTKFLFDNRPSATAVLPLTEDKTPPAPVLDEIPADQRDAQGEVDINEIPF